MLITKTQYQIDLNAAQAVGRMQGKRMALEEWADSDNAELALTRRERDEALSTLEDALALLEVLYANAVGVDMAQGTKSPITEDLERLREVIRRD